MVRKVISNYVVTDDGFRGLAICNEEENGFTTVAPFENETASTEWIDGIVVVSKKLFDVNIARKFLADHDMHFAAIKIGDLLKMSNRDDGMPKLFVVKK